jgi:hypothetical protein
MIYNWNQYNEALAREESLKQLKRVRELSRKTDIGDRLVRDNSKQGDGANLHYMSNIFDRDIESYEKAMKKNKKFRPGWNTKGLTSPFKKD